MAPASAQIIPDVEVGLKPFGSYHESDIDSVNLLNGDLSVKIPLVSYPQRGDLTLDFFLSTGFDRPRPPLSITGQGTSNVITTLQYAYRPTLLLNWSGNYKLGGYTSFVGAGPCATTEFRIYGGEAAPPPAANPDCASSGTGVPIVVATDPMGGAHQFAAVGNQLSGSNGSTLQESIDGSGLQMQLLPNVNASLPDAFTDRRGTVYSFTSSQTKITDRNGNFISLANGQWTDSAGRGIQTPPTPQTQTLARCPGSGDVAGESTSASSWTVPGYGGPNVTYTLCFINEHVLAGYTCSAINSGGVNYTFVYTSQVSQFLNAVVLPKGEKWEFVTYNGVAQDGIPNNDGTVFEIILPTGGTIKYSLAPTFSPDATMGSVCEAALNQVPGMTPRMTVRSKAVNANDGTGFHTWTYTYGSAPNGNPTTTVTDPMGNDTVHTFSTVPNAGVNYYETSTVQYNQSKSANVILKQSATSYSGYVNPQDFVTTAMALPMSTTVTTPAGTVTTTNTYDSGAVITGTPAMMGLVAGDTTHPLVYGNLIDVKTSGIGTTSTLRETSTTPQWQNSSTYLSANLLDFPASVVAKDGNGNSCEETDYTYDDSNHFVSLDPSNTFEGHTAAPASVRGNLSLTKRILSLTPCTQTALSGTPITSQTWVADLGTVEKVMDPLLNLTSYSRDPASHIFVTGTKNALNQQISAGYDSNTGLLTSYTDLNSNSTTYGYDILGRLTCVEYPDGGSTGFSINDAALTVDKITRMSGADACSSAAGNMDLQYQHDGLARQTQSRLLSDSSGTVLIDTKYDPDGRVASVSNAYRSNLDATYGVTAYTYDPLSRLTVQTNPGSHSVQWCFDGQPTSAQNNCRTHSGGISGEWVDFEDENGNDWQRTSDALGRLVEVMEPSGTSPSPTMEADYTYNALSNLLSVKQCGALCSSPSANAPGIRSFSYDSLSRLLSAANPETGSVGYNYDADGNVQNKTDARSRTTNYTYDVLNRVQSKSYSDAATPCSFYQYDSVTNGIGHLSNAWTLSGSTSTCISAASTKTAPTPPAAPAFLTMKSILSYDKMGRPTYAQQQQCVGSQCSAPAPYSLTMAYDLVGNMNTLTNSTGAANQSLTLTNYFDEANRPCLTTSNWGGTSTVTFPKNLFQTNPSTSGTTGGYAPFGGLQNWYMGSTSTAASTACSATPASPINVTEGYTNRLWVNSVSATGQIP